MVTPVNFCPLSLLLSIHWQFQSIWGWVLQEVGNVADHHFTLWSRKCPSDHYHFLNTCHDNDHLRIKSMATSYWVSTMCSTLSTSVCIMVFSFHKTTLRRLTFPKLYDYRGRDRFQHWSLCLLPARYYSFFYSFAQLLCQRHWASSRGTEIKDKDLALRNLAVTWADKPKVTILRAKCSDRRDCWVPWAYPGGTQNPV